MVSVAGLYNWRHSMGRNTFGLFDAQRFSETLWRSKKTLIISVELRRIIGALRSTAVVIGRIAETLVSHPRFAQAYPQLLSRLVVVNVPIFPERLPHWGMLLYPMPLNCSNN